MKVKIQFMINLRTTVLNIIESMKKSTTLGKHDRKPTRNDRRSYGQVAGTESSGQLPVNKHQFVSSMDMHICTYCVVIY